MLRRGDGTCYVVFRKDRRKGVPVFASILHVSEPELFRRMARPFARHLLLRHGAVAMLAEDRVVALPTPPSLRLRSPRRKMFRSASLEPAQIDYLYSELVVRLVVSAEPETKDGSQCERQLHQLVDDAGLAAAARRR